jgi:chemotaxis methyl-accepting protein methylase
VKIYIKIEEILKRDILMTRLNIDLTKHSIENLQKYLNKLKSNENKNL